MPPGLAASQFVLGLDYSTQVGSAPVRPGFVVAPPPMATDTQGAVYLANSASLYKYTATGQIAWRVDLDSAPDAIATDASGNVYALINGLLKRISSDGNGVAVLMGFGANLFPRFVVVDSKNRVWVAGFTNAGVDNPLKTTPGAFQQTLSSTTFSHIFAVRLSPAANAIEYATYLAGSGEDLPAGIAVDSTGSLIITGTTTSTDFPFPVGGPASGRWAFLTRLKPGGSGLIYSTLAPGPVPNQPTSLAVTAQGGAALVIPFPTSTYQAELLVYAPDGSPVFQRLVPGTQQAVAVDAAGNIYSGGVPVGGNAPVKNNISTCGGSFLSVFSPSGDTLQASWLPIASERGLLGLAIGGSGIYIAATQISSNVAVMTLNRLSQHPETATEPLACLTDAAVFQIPGAKPPYASVYPNTPAGITPGEVVSLFGEGLGQAQGVQPAISPAGRFPNELSSVQVFFDGQPSPLLYVQDSQINAVAPWSLTPGKTTRVCIDNAERQTNCLTVPVVASAPAVYTLFETYAAAVNEDGTINSDLQPAPPGSIVAIFATGLGPTTPALSDGEITGLPLPQNQFPVTAETLAVSGAGLNSIPWEVMYYGPAPLEIAGLSQINVRVPSSLPDTLAVQTVYLHVADVVGEFSIFTGKP